MESRQYLYAFLYIAGFGFEDAENWYFAVRVVTGGDRDSCVASKQYSPEYEVPMRKCCT